MNGNTQKLYKMNGKEKKFINMRAFLGIDQKKKQRMLLNSICLEHCLNLQQVMEDIKDQGFENLTLKETINFIKLNY